MLYLGTDFEDVPYWAHVAVYRGISPQLAGAAGGYLDPIFPAGGGGVAGFLWRGSDMADRGIAKDQPGAQFKGRVLAFGAAMRMVTPATQMGWVLETLVGLVRVVVDPAGTEIASEGESRLVTFINPAPGTNQVTRVPEPIIDGPVPMVPVLTPAEAAFGLTGRHALKAVWQDLGPTPKGGTYTKLEAAVAVAMWWEPGGA